MRTDPAGEIPAPRPVHRIQVPPQGRVLCFSPHPDDEVLGPGGALHLHVEQGDPVRVVVVFDGRAGDPDGNDPDGLARRRREESRAGLSVLGVTDVEYWRYPDSRVLAGSDVEIGVGRVIEAVRGFSPDLIYLPWRGEHHPDHFATHVAVVEALERMAFPGRALGYEVGDALLAETVLDITAIVDKKVEALRCHGSQLVHGDFERVMLALHAFRSSLHMRGRGHGEAYCTVWPRVPAVGDG